MLFQNFACRIEKLFRKKYPTVSVSRSSTFQFFSISMIFHLNSIFFFFFFADIPHSQLQPSSGNDTTPNDKLLTSLEKQLSIETKVKNGAENMIETIGHHGRDKKLLVEAQQMLADSKAKIEFLRLRILKVRQNRQLKQASEENGDGKQRMETTLEERVEELLHRLRIEAAVVAGAKNVIRILQNNKVPDKKQLQAVRFLIYFFVLKL